MSANGLCRSSDKHLVAVWKGPVYGCVMMYSGQKLSAGKEKAGYRNNRNTIQRVLIYTPAFTRTLAWTGKLKIGKMFDAMFCWDCIHCSISFLLLANRSGTWVVFWDVFLLIIIVKVVYLDSVPVSSNQSGNLAYHQSLRTASYWMFFVFHTIVY